MQQPVNSNKKLECIALLGRYHEFYGELDQKDYSEKDSDMMIALNEQLISTVSGMTEVELADSIDVITEIHEVVNSCVSAIEQIKLLMIDKKVKIAQYR